MEPGVLAIDHIMGTTGTWKGRHPAVSLVTTTYQTGVTLTKEAMKGVESHLSRLPGLEKWFVDIVPSPTAIGTPICS